MRIVALEEVKEYLGVSGEENDALINGMIDVACAYVDDTTGTAWERRGADALYPVARQAVFVKVWLMFYTARDNDLNAASFVRKNLTEMIQMLQIQVLADKKGED